MKNGNGLRLRQAGGLQRFITIFSAIRNLFVAQLQRGLRKQVCECPKGFDLVWKGFNETMCNRARHRNAVQASRLHIRGGRGSGDEGCECTLDRRVYPVSAAPAEIDNRTAFSRRDHPRRFGRDHALKPDLIESERLKPLRFGNGATTSKIGSISKKGAPFGRALMSPVNRKDLSHDRNPGLNRFKEVR